MPTNPQNNGYTAQGLALAIVTLFNFFVKIVTTAAHFSLPAVDPTLIQSEQTVVGCAIVYLMSKYQSDDQKTIAALKAQIADLMAKMPSEPAKV